MSASTQASALRSSSIAAGLSRTLQRNTWVIGLWIVLAVLLLFTRLIQPEYGATGIAALAIAALPFAYAAAGQTVVIISGGLDLSIAAMMALVSVSAATLMDGRTDEIGLFGVAVILLFGVALGAINGLTVVLTRIPDIVVTLAFFFIWEGAALLVMSSPGGEAAQWLKDLVRGPDVNEWVPKALILLIVTLAAVWIPLRRSRLGLWLYALGSDRQAAFRSGVPIGRTKVASYAVAGLFAAMGGLVLVALTGSGNPVQGPYLLTSVAAVVLGGVSLAGGKGSFMGPIVAIFILRLVRQDMVFMDIDPNVAQVLEGVLMVVLVLIGGVTAMRSRRA